MIRRADPECTWPGSHVRLSTRQSNVSAPTHVDVGTSISWLLRPYTSTQIDSGDDLSTDTEPSAGLSSVTGLAPRYGPGLQVMGTGDEMTPRQHQPQTHRQLQPLTRTVLTRNKRPPNSSLEGGGVEEQVYDLPCTPEFLPELDFSRRSKMHLET